MITSTLNEMDGNPKRYKKIPPEGGWGFLVLLGLSFVLVCSSFSVGANRIII